MVWGAIKSGVSGAFNAIIGGGSSSRSPAGAPSVDYAPAIKAQMAASLDKMSMFVGSQQMQADMINSASAKQHIRDLQMMQAKSDAKLDIMELDFKANAAEAEMGHKEAMTGSANQHIESLAKQNQIELQRQNLAQEMMSAQEALSSSDEAEADFKLPNFDFK